MNDHYSSSDEGAKQARQLDSEASRKAQTAAQAATEELRNSLQTKGEQAKVGPGYAPGRDDCPNDLDTPGQHNQRPGLETV